LLKEEFETHTEPIEELAMLFTNLPFRRSILALAISLACAPNAATAAAINVGGSCTLVHAINNANADADTDGTKGCKAGSGADTINLAHNTSYQLPEINNNTDGPNGLPSVTSVITINGNRSTVSRAGATDTPRFRLFHVSEAGKLVLKSITLSNGRLTKYDPYDPGDGGGLFNKGSVTLQDSHVLANQADGGNGGGIANTGTLVLINTVVSGNKTRSHYASRYSGGGGIFNAGDLTLKQSTVSSNYASGFESDYYDAVGGAGGGIKNSGKAVLKNSTLSGNGAYFVGGGLFNRGTLSVSNSLLSNNGSSYGGGINNGGGLNVSNSTLSNNGATNGGGIINEGTLSVSNSTLSGNRSYWGGGISNYGAMSVNNSTLSNNKSKANYGGGVNNNGPANLTNSTLSGNDGGGLVNYSTVSLKNTIIANSRNTSDCYSIGDTQLNGVNLIEDGSCGAPLSGDPKLGSLKDNGGLTRTHALLDGSPALDAGRCSSFVDQRGVSRPQPEGGRCDIGAYEHIPVTQNSVSPTVWNSVDFITAQIASGGLAGVGQQQVQRQLAALNQLVAAGNFRDRTLDAKACDQLTGLLRRIDVDNAPDANDYLTGSEASALAEQLTQLKSAWECP